MPRKETARHAQPADASGMHPCGRHYDADALQTLCPKCGVLSAPELWQIPEAAACTRYGILPVTCQGWCRGLLPAQGPPWHVGQLGALVVAGELLRAAWPHEEPQRDGIGAVRGIQVCRHGEMDERLQQGPPPLLG